MSAYAERLDAFRRQCRAAPDGRIERPVSVKPGDALAIYEEVAMERACSKAETRKTDAVAGTSYRERLEAFKAVVEDAVPPLDAIAIPDDIYAFDARSVIEGEKFRRAEAAGAVLKDIENEHYRALDPERVKILEDAADITSGDREAEYGPPAFNLQCAGELKLLLRKHARRELTAGEWEAIDLAMTKLGRIVTGPKPKRDTYVDAACYLAIAGEIALKTA